MVPLLAVGISFATSFLRGPAGQQQIQTLIDTLLTKVAPQIGLVAKAGGDGDARAKVTEFINSAIQNVSSGALGITATIALIFTAISLLSNVESTLNDIWGVRQGRSWAKRIPQYFTAIALGGLLLMAAVLNAGPYFDETRRLLESTPLIGGLVTQLMPVLLLVLTLGFFYQLMPNTRVDWQAALVGGAFAGVLLHLNNVFSSIYFGQVLQNSKLYGSLGIIPVVLIGLYFSWTIVLFGAQVSYVFQNRRAYLQEKHAQSINQRGLEFVALRLMTCIATRFQAGTRPATALELAEAIEVPTRLVQRILDPLVQTQLLIEVAGAETGYSPARPLDKISCHDVLDSMRSGLGQPVATREEPAKEQVSAELEKIRDAERQAGQGKTLHDLAQDLAQPHEETQTQSV